MPTDTVVYGPALIAGALLATSRGAPLWPYWDAATRRQIEDTAAELGVRLVHCSHPVPAIERRRGAEIVASVGAIAERPARLYAHLTGRCHERFATFEALRSALRPSVVFVPWGLADADLLAWASSVSGSPTEAEPLVGLFLGFDEASLYLQALTRAAALHWSGAPRPRIEVWPTERFTERPAGRGRRRGRHRSRRGVARRSSVLLDGETPADVLRAELGRGAGVLTIKTHADGVDAKLTGGAAFCRMTTPPALPADERLPCCIETGRCARRGAALAEVVASGALLSPGDLAARILVWAVCQGVLIADGALDPRWGFLPPMLESPRLGAILTTWNIVIFNDARLFQLSSELAAGRALGDAAGAYNGNRAHLGASLCLFGDPRARLPRSAPSSWRIADSDLRPEAPWPRARRRAGDPSAFVDAYVRGAPAAAATTERSAQLAALKQRAVAALDRHRSAPGAEAAREAQGAVLAFFATRGPLRAMDWLARASLSLARRPERCRQCNAPTTILIATLEHAESRRIRLCPCCGIAEDAPHHRRRWATFDGTALAIGGDPFTAETQVALSISCTDEARSAIQPWPVDGRGIAERACTVTARVPGSVLMSAVVLDSWDFSVLTVRAHLARRLLPIAARTSPSVAAISGPEELAR